MQCYKIFSIFYTLRGISFIFIKQSIKILATWIVTLCWISPAMFILTLIMCFVMKLNIELLFSGFVFGMVLFRKIFLLFAHRLWSVLDPHRPAQGERTSVSVHLLLRHTVYVLNK